MVRTTKTFKKQSCFPEYGCFLVVLLLLVLIANASDTNKATISSKSSKASSAICPKVLPSISQELQSSARRGPDRIVNGDRAPYMRPYMAALVSDTRGFFCSASLLSEQWALTAAHCSIDKLRDILRVGGVNVLQGTDIGIEEAIPHPQYIRGVQGTEENDLQLLKLKTPVPADSKFFYINLESSYPATSSYVRACGYGDSLGTANPNSGVLREVDVPVQDSSQCQNQYEDLQVVIKDSTHVCAGYDKGGCDSCYGDSGGPLFAFGKDMILVQVAIVSFGLECALPRRPGVYTRLSYYVPWMTSAGAVFRTTTDGVNVFGSGKAPSKVPHVGDHVKDDTETQDGSGFEGPEILAENDDEVKPTTEPRSACFPSNAVVTLEDGREKMMKDLLIGDRVRVGPREFSDVFMFTHRRNYGHYQFAQVECQACTTPLLLSLDHVLSVNGVPKPARMIQVGDFIIKASGQFSKVSHISYVRRKGLFNPQTIDGRIIVNDVLVTTYTAAVDKRIAHAALTPLRFWFKNFNWIWTLRGLD